MRSEREPFATAEADFTNTEDAYEYAKDEPRTGSGLEAYGSVRGASEEGAEYVDDVADDASEPVDGANTEIASPSTEGHEASSEASDAVAEVADAQDATDDASRYGPDYNRLPEGYRFEGTDLICPGDSKRTEPRVNGLVRIDRELRDRVKVVADLERRKMTAVVEEAIRQLLQKTNHEPRPYLPLGMMRDQTIRLSWYMSEEMDMELRGRALCEGRDVMVLVRRAILDYVESSPYDPLHLMKCAESENNAEKPSRIDEGASDVSEYQTSAEVRLNPSEPQQTGYEPSEEVMQ